MKRRNFLKLTSTASVLSMLPHEVFSFLQTAGIPECPDVSGKKIVLIQMAGANDGLNTIIPVNQYDLYANLRPKLKINNSGPNGFIHLDTTLRPEDQIGLHPSMTGFKNLYDQGLMRIIQGTGYPDQNKSHFKSTDLWLTGGDGTRANFSYESGWMGRFMENYYTDYLHADFPLGIQLGSADKSLGFHGAAEHGLSINISNKDTSGFYSVINGLGGTPPTNIPNSEYGELIRFLVDLDASTNSYSQAISTAFSRGTNTIDYPQNDLSDQLKTVARFISGGLETKIYLVKISGFDTHEWQVVENAAHTGFHAGLLQQISSAVEAFIIDLNNLNKGEDVMTLTFSEFGRKAAENANFGTDHGEVAPMFMFGKTVTPGISGTNINLHEATEDNNFQITTIQHDYRSVFSTILQDWLGAKNAVLDASIYDNTNQIGFSDKKIPGLIHSTQLVPPSCYTEAVPVPIKTVGEIVIYPNPSSGFITISCPADDEIYLLTIYTVSGTKVNTCPNHVKGPEMTIDTTHLAIGFYNFKIETKKQTVTKKVIIRR